MKTLIGIAGCHQNIERANNQRATWVKDVQKADGDVVFFSGERPSNRCRLLPDEQCLDCADSYEKRKQKIKEMCRWALHRGYDRLVKIDDDTYVRPERLDSLGEMDYGGFRINQKFSYDGRFICNHDTVLGAFYVISRRAMQVLVGSDWFPECPFEDCWVSMQLELAGIPLVDLRPRLGYEFYDSTRPPADYPHQTPPLATNNIVASWEYRTQAEMNTVHLSFQRSMGA